MIKDNPALNQSRDVNKTIDFLKSGDFDLWKL